MSLLFHEGWSKSLVVYGSFRDKLTKSEKHIAGLCEYHISWGNMQVPGTEGLAAWLHGVGPQHVECTASWFRALMPFRGQPLQNKGTYAFPHDHRESKLNTLAWKMQ